jgi:hypothetical protein
MSGPASMLFVICIPLRKQWRKHANQGISWLACFRTTVIHHNHEFPTGKSRMCGKRDSQQAAPRLY